MTIREKMLKVMEENRMVSPGDRVAVALSGGKDSVCLLHLLNDVKEKLSISLLAVHVHHGLRANGDLDEAFVRGLCESLHIPLTVVSVDVKALVKTEGLSVEEAARKLRYEAFEQLSADRIALAHHRDDQAETVLLNLLRGSGLKGLGGMKPVRGKYIRPLLNVGSEEILAYLKENNLKHREDESNEDLTYSRNRIRHELLPYLKANFNPNIVDTLCRSASLLSEDEAYLDEEAERIAGSLQDELPVSLVQSLPSSLRGRVIRRFIGDKNLKDLSQKTVSLVEEMALRKSGEGAVSLPNCLTMVRTGGIIKVYNPDFSSEAHEASQEVLGEYPLGVPGEVSLPDGRKITLELCDNPGISHILATAASPKAQTEKWCVIPAEGLCVRSRRRGDYIRIFDNEHRLCCKSLQDFFVDARVSAEQRDFVPLLARGSEVFWIAGYRLSDGVRVPGEALSSQKVVHILLQMPEWQRREL